MKPTASDSTGAPPPPRVRLCLGVTGHREDNPAFAAHRAEIEAHLAQVLDLIAAAVADEPPPRGAGAIAPIRLHCLLADGTDQIAAAGALARGWHLVAPLPFGVALNAAINSHPATAHDARAVLSGAESSPHGCSAEVRERAARIRALATQARLFQLADRDDLIARLFLEKLQHPDDPRKASAFAAESSERVALASRIVVEQSDLLVAVWDGTSRAFVGGTGHTIQVALETGAPVVWIDANAPARWRILLGPEALTHVAGATNATNPTHAANAHAPSSPAPTREAQLQALVRAALHPAPARAPSAHHAHRSRRGHPLQPDRRSESAPHSDRAHRSDSRHRSHPAHRLASGPEALDRERLPRRSNPLWHLYRRIEAVFGEDTFKRRLRSLRQTYETPDAIASGSASKLLAEARALPGQEEEYVAGVETAILRRFAWADGVSAQLSDTYRGSMIANFLLAPLAIVGGLAYLPMAGPEGKWPFALFELALLCAILAITLTGQKRRWHSRWFETRRVAEYLRHAPILLLLGVSRAAGRWPQGTETSWPEWYARHGLRDVGLPHLAVTQSYLRRAVGDLLHQHVVRQRDYHIAKAKRLAAVHHRLDKLSEILFSLAIVAVAAYLVLKGGGALRLWPDTIAARLSDLFTFLAVLLPTFGGAVAAIRYFGDFERFAAISRVTSEKLETLHTRIAQWLAAPDAALDYGRAADLAHATDDVVVSEIESWQAVFGGKHVTVPV